MKMKLNPDKLPKITTLSDNAKVVLDKRYIIKDKEGNPLETHEQLFYRIAKAVADVERDYVDEKVDIDRLTIDFYYLMTNMEFLPNSPTIMNAGIPNGQLSACFVLPVHDSMESIFETLKHTALIHKSGGGTGFDFSELRPKNDTVGSTGGVASGPLSFISIYDAATEQVKQGGRRRGASMGILRVDHPDILDFIHAKEEDGKFSNFNFSVAITDKFMEAAKTGGTYDLVSPVDGHVVQTLDAREVYDLIVDKAWRSGDPGIVFIDTANKDNPTPKLGAYASTNPCITADSWIDTDEGAVQVKDLIGKQFNAVVNGKSYRSTEDGFFFKGNKDVVLLETVEGYSLKDTKDHKVECLSDDGSLRMVPTKALIPGDRIVLSRSTEYEWKGNHEQFGFGDGYLLGLLIGDGWVNSYSGYLGYWDKNADNINLRDQNTMPTVMKKAAEYASMYKTRSDYTGWARIKGRDNFILKCTALRDLCAYFGICNKENKTVTPSIEECSSDFLKGLIRGLFDTDGSVQGNNDNGFTVRLSQSNLSLLQSVQRILLRFGIVSHLYANRRDAGFSYLPDGKGGYKNYATKAQHELSISSVYVKVFAERISLFRDHKLERLNRILTEYPDRYNRKLPSITTATFKSITTIGEEAVFDCTIDEIHKFSCNGLVISNCGEIFLLPYEACNLGSINLSKMVTGRKEIIVDWAKLKETVHKAVHFLDNVIDASVFPIPEITEKVKLNRKIGLGVMGWADLLFLLDIPYDSERALMLANDIMAFIRREAMAKSKILATYKRPFPAYEDSIYKEKGEGPYRNATVTTVAPTGTLSMIAGCSSGIEPIFALYFVKHVMNGERLAELNPYFMNSLKKHKCDNKEIMDEVMSTGSVRKVDTAPDELKEVFGTAMDISPEYHLRMQAAFQRHIDNAVSKTVNLPHEATREDIDYIYRHAHEWGCKGVTVYRDGCKSVQVLYTGTGDNKATGETKEVSVDTTAHVIDPNVGIKPMHRPEELTGFTRSLRTGLGDLYLTVNEYEGRPFEVFATIGRSGRSITAKAEAIGRLVSLALRSGIHVRDVVKQLKGIGGEHPVFQKKGMVLSIPDAVGMVLEQKYLKDEKVVASETGNDLIKPNCPDCGEELVFQEGCLLCPNCAYSKCG